jgi:hypothetical protein
LLSKSFSLSEERDNNSFPNESSRVFLSALKCK